MSKVQTGLDILQVDSTAQKLCSGKIGYLCHNASCDKNLISGITVIKKTFGERFIALFSPQHGIFADVQANMIETASSTHPYFKLPIHSLYGESRIPTDQMLEDIDTIIFDLQDVGARIYTYIHTLSLLMKACSVKGVRVIVLDRPNPIGGVQVEGNVLDPAYASFVGLHPIPMRHGMTMGEMANFLHSLYHPDCDFRVIAMKGWKRSMYFEDTELPFIPPSPNIPRIESTLIYPGAVLLEGTTISEGRGTTRPFEIIGIPGIEAFSFCDTFKESLSKTDITGFALRPTYFIPTFDKHVGATCSGFELYINDRERFSPWKFTQLYLRELYHYKKDLFSWISPPYEYEETLLPIDILNGTDLLRHWVEKNGSYEELLEIESHEKETFMKQRDSSLIKDYTSG